MSERFDGARAWALLTPVEQAEIGRLAIEGAVASWAGMQQPVGLPAPADWPCDPVGCFEHIEDLLDEAVWDALGRLGLIDCDSVPPAPASLDEPRP